MAKKRRSGSQRRFRQEMIEAYGERCMLCGFNAEIQAHHIVQRSDGGSNKPYNLILLCERHHAMAHAKDRNKRLSKEYLFCARNKAEERRIQALKQNTT